MLSLYNARAQRSVHQCMPVWNSPTRALVQSLHSPRALSLSLSLSLLLHDIYLDDLKTEFLMIIGSVFHCMVCAILQWADLLERAAVFLELVMHLNISLFFVCNWDCVFCLLRRTTIGGGVRSSCPAAVLFLSSPTRSTTSRRRWEILLCVSFFPASNGFWDRLHGKKVSGNIS